MRARYASRLNSFKVPGPDGRAPASLAELVRRAASVEGLSEVDFNYPDHIEAMGPRAAAALLAEHRLHLNGLAMRYYSVPAFKRGAFTNPDPAIRRKAIDLTKRGVDALAEAGGAQMTLWLGQDGFDHPFQVDYEHVWELELAGIAEVAAHAGAIDVAIEYKPNEPRGFSLLGDLGTTLAAIAEVGAPNLGITLDFAHVLYAGEQPAFAAMLAARRARLLGVHLNDAYGKRDDGLMVGSVNTIATLEFLLALRRANYSGALYFDTFPDTAALDPVAECAHNIRTVEGMLGLIDSLSTSNALARALEAQDAVAAHRLVQAALFPQG